jgi:hypothetical protein
VADIQSAQEEFKAMKLIDPRLNKPAALLAEPRTWKPRAGIHKLASLIHGKKYQAKPCLQHTPWSPAT